MAYQEKSAGELTADMDMLAQSRLAAIVSSSDDVIISKTLDGIVTTWNASATRILGFEAEEMVGEPILRIIPRGLHIRVQLQGLLQPPQPPTLNTPSGWQEALDHTRRTPIQTRNGSL